MVAASLDEGKRVPHPQPARFDHPGIHAEHCLEHVDDQVRPEAPHIAGPVPAVCMIRLQLPEGRGREQVHRRVIEEGAGGCR
jgi:hypothetical protein